MEIKRAGEEPRDSVEGGTKMGKMKKKADPQIVLGTLNSSCSKKKKKKSPSPIFLWFIVCSSTYQWQRAMVASELCALMKHGHDSHNQAQ